MDKNTFDVNTLENELSKVMFEKAETEMDIRRGELLVKKINALANLEKNKLEFMKIQLQEKNMALSDRRLQLDEMQSKYNMVSDMARKPDKTIRTIGKMMVGFFAEQDKQVLSIMKAAQKLQDLNDE